MPHKKKLARYILLATAKLSGKRRRGRQKRRWNGYTFDLAWSRLGVEPRKLSEIAENREVFWLLLGLLPPRPSPEESGYECECKLCPHCWKLLQTSADGTELWLPNCYSVFQSKNVIWFWNVTWNKTFTNLNHTDSYYQKMIESYKNDSTPNNQCFCGWNTGCGGVGQTMLINPLIHNH